MDQFNKVLAAFLLLVVAVGISLFIFSRLGILSRIFPSTKLVSSTTTTQVSQSPSPTQTPTPTPQANKPGILGWLSQLGKPKITLTPSPAQNSKLETLNPNNIQTQTPTPMKDPELNTNNSQGTVVYPTTTNLQVTKIPEVTIIPYGSTSAQTYPASGIEMAFVPAVSLSALFGLFLKHKAK